MQDHHSSFGPETNVSPLRRESVRIHRFPNTSSVITLDVAPQGMDLFKAARGTFTLLDEAMSSELGVGIARCCFSATVLASSFGNSTFSWACLGRGGGQEYRGVTIPLRHGGRACIWPDARAIFFNAVVLADSDALFGYSVT